MTGSPGAQLGAATGGGCRAIRCLPLGADADRLGADGRLTRSLRPASTLRAAARPHSPPPWTPSPPSCPSAWPRLPSRRCRRPRPPPPSALPAPSAVARWRSCPSAHWPPQAPSSAPCHPVRRRAPRTVTPAARATLRASAAAWRPRRRGAPRRSSLAPPGGLPTLAMKQQTALPALGTMAWSSCCAPVRCWTRTWRWPGGC